MKIISVILIVISAVLLLSDFNENNISLLYFLITFTTKAIGLLIGYIGIQLITKSNKTN